MEIEQGSTLHASTNTMNVTLTLIQNLEAGSLLTLTQAESLMEELLSGRVDTPEIVRLLQALNSRPLVAAELASFARVMRQHAAPVFPVGVALPEKMVDTCGTGGDGSGTFNISTAAAIVASAAGARVAKHGNRSVSSRCGSADVLEVIGIRIDLPLEHAGRSIREIGIGFLGPCRNSPCYSCAQTDRQAHGVQSARPAYESGRRPASGSWRVFG